MEMFLIDYSKGCSNCNCNKFIIREGYIICSCCGFILEAKTNENFLSIGYNPLRKRSRKKKKKKLNVTNRIYNKEKNRIV